LYDRRIPSALAGAAAAATSSNWAGVSALIPFFIGAREKAKAVADDCVTARRHLRQMAI